VTKQQKLFKILLDTDTSASLIREIILTDKDKHKLQKDEQGPTVETTISEEGSLAQYMQQL